MSFWVKLLEIRDKLDSTDYYELLGVERDADTSTIVDRYYLLTRKLHPDRYSRERDRNRIDALTQVVARMAEAVRVLKVEATRLEYDQQVKDGLIRFDSEHKNQRGAAPRMNPTARNLYEKGLALFRSGDREGARSQLKMAKSFDPGSGLIAEALTRVDRDEADVADSTATSTTPSLQGSALSALIGVQPAAAAVPAATSEPKSSQASAPVAPPAPPKIPQAPAEMKSRRHPRRPSTLSVGIRLSTSEHVGVFVSRDVSRGGIFIRAKEPLPAGTPIELKIELPDKTHISILAIVARIATSSRGEPGMGIEFKDISTLAREKLDSHLRNLAAPSSGHDAPQISFESLSQRLEKLRSVDDNTLLQATESSTAGEIEETYRHQLARLDAISGRCPDPRTPQVIGEMRRAFDDAFKRLSAARIKDVETTLPSPAAPTQSLYVGAIEAGGLAANHEAVQLAQAGLALLEAKSYIEARVTLAEAIEQLPYDGRLQAAWFLANGYELADGGSKPEAMEQFRASLEHFPQCEEAILALRKLS